MDAPRKIDRRRFVGLAGLSALGAYVAACGAPPAPTAAPTAAPAQGAAPAAQAAPSPTAATTAAAPAAAAPAKARENITLRLWHWDTFLLEPYKQVGAAFT